MQDKVCLITGATSGIGLVTAEALARQGARLVLVGRDRSKTEGVVARIQKESGNPHVEGLIADLSAQQQVRTLAKQFRERHQRLDVLINNAGALRLKLEKTCDGHEMTLALNHLAYFLLTHELLDVLKASVPARIINVSSGAHRKGGNLDFDDLAGTRRYNGWRAYSRSKLMNLLFTFELHRRLNGGPAGSGITVNAVHPGWVATGFGGNNGLIGHLWRLAANLFALGVNDGARTVIHLASSPEVANISGRYFVRAREEMSSAASLDEVAARRLWQMSMELTGLA